MENKVKDKTKGWKTKMCDKKDRKVKADRQEKNIPISKYHKQIPYTCCDLYFQPVSITE